MSIEALRDLVSGLNVSAASLAALGVALDHRVNGTAIDRSIQPEVEAIVAALGATDWLNLPAPELRPVLAEIKCFSMLNTKLLVAGTRTSGWNYTDDTLQAAGEVSISFPHTLQKTIAPKLDDLSQRLERGAFLDIGVGVGMLSIEMARLWPALNIVGIDPWAPALVLARKNVKAAGLEARIKLREQAAQDLSDSDAFDLVWLPSPFFAGCSNRPGGRGGTPCPEAGRWVLVATVRSNNDSIAGLVWQLRLAQFGGWRARPQEAESKLRALGFGAVQSLPAPPHAPVALIAGRK